MGDETQTDSRTALPTGAVEMTRWSSRGLPMGRPSTSRTTSLARSPAWAAAGWMAQTIHISATTLHSFSGGKKQPQCEAQQ